jgi:3,4-dihydroxy 2-butanone 4-phosphate synthase/GTP cyclohydrolase II
MSTPFDSPESAIESIRDGETVIVVDTNPSHACGAFVVAASHVTAEILSFFLNEGRGFLSVPVDQSICLKFGLRPLENTRSDGLCYTLSYNLADEGSTTGQSTSDRSKAIRAIVDPSTSPSELRTPGFIQPALTTSSGVLESQTFASAATDLSRLAGLAPAGVIIHILREDGELARLEDLFKLAASHELKIVSLEGLVAHRASHVASEKSW